MYYDRRGNGQKPAWTKPPGQKPREQLRENLYRGLLSGFFVLGLLKIGGSEMCDVLFAGVPGCVTKCDRGRGSKFAKNSVTYFMDGPLALSLRDVQNFSGIKFPNDRNFWEKMSINFTPKNSDDFF